MSRTRSRAAGHRGAPAGQPGVLARRSINGTGLWALAVAASAPLTVLGGGVTNTYAATGVVGVPLSFLLITIVLIPLTLAYVAMSRHLPNAATFYTVLARGLGRPIGVAGAAVALLGYNAIQIGLYGLFGAFVSNLAHGGPWWMWAGLGWLLIKFVGRRHVLVNARLVLFALTLEIAVIMLFDVAAFLHPGQGHVDAGPLLPHTLWVPGVGGVAAFAIAAFVGYETTAVYSEEARLGHSKIAFIQEWIKWVPPNRLVGRATGLALGFCGVLYAVSAWALIEAAGPNQVRGITLDTFTGVLDRLPWAGPLMSYLAILLVIYSIWNAMLSFHNTCARYAFALARETVLPKGFGRTDKNGAPAAGSWLQSSLAFWVLVWCTNSHVDPIAGLFTWASAIGALAILSLLVATSLAALIFFARTRAIGQTASFGEAVVAPTVGAVVGVGVLATIIGNLDSLLGVTGGKTLAVPGCIVLAGALGLLRAGVIWLRDRRRYKGLGHGLPDPIRTLPPVLKEVEV